MVNNAYSEEYKETIGVDFDTSNQTSEENVSVQLQMWDTAGQKRFQLLRPTYLRNAPVIIVAISYDTDMPIADYLKKYFNIINTNTNKNTTGYFNK